MHTILTFWPGNSQHQLCWEIKYASYARDLNGKPHLINMLVFVHTEENMLYFSSSADTRGERACWKDIEIFMYSKINPAITLDMCPLLPATVQSPSMDIIEEVFLQYALVRIIEYVFLLNFIFTKIIWDVLYWSQTHVRIYHSRLYFWRLIDNTFLMIWNKHKATQQKYFFNIQNYFFFRRFLLIVNALKAFIPMESSLLKHIKDWKNFIV